MSLQPFVDRHGGVTYHREQGELVNDPFVDRRRLEEEQEILARLARQRIEVPERVDRLAGAHADGEGLRSFGAPARLQTGEHLDGKDVALIEV
jgi:hypothetical protein